MKQSSLGVGFTRFSTDRQGSVDSQLRVNGRIAASQGGETGG